MADDSEHDGTGAPGGSRRAFLLGTALGAAATTGLATEAEARTDRNAKAPAKKPGEAAASQPSVQRHAAGHGAFLNDDDYATIAAITHRLFPS